MATLASSQALPFRILVLEGPLSQRPLMLGMGGTKANGLIELEGRSLPYRPIVYEGRQRVKTTWYAGNTVATQQVMGPIEEPTVVNGMWKDRFLGDGQARGMANLFDTLRRSGSLVEVTWGAGILENTAFGFSFVRQGIVARTKFTFDRPQDVAWEVEFHWNGQGEQITPFVNTALVNPKNGLEVLRDSLAKLEDSVDGFLSGSKLTQALDFSNSLVAGFEIVADGITDTINLFSNAALATSDAAEIPAVAIERGINVADRMSALSQAVVLSLVGSVTQDLVQTEELLRRLGLDIDLTGFLEPTLFPTDDATNLLTFGGDRINTVRDATERQEQAVNIIDSLTGMILPEVIAEERPPAGTDLRDLAQKHYGDPDMWIVIARHNGIVGSKVPSLPSAASDDPGRPILIPRRPTGELARLTC